MSAAENLSLKNILDTQITLDSLGSSTPLPATAPSTPVVSTKLPTPSTTHTSGLTSSIEEKALNLLGSGVPAESVASALGVTPSRIAQLLSQKIFSDRVAALRYESLQKHNLRDSKYDSLEDRLILKLESSLPLLVKPESILKAITTVNGAKRRGQSAPDQVSNQKTVVTLILPTIIAQKFSVDTNNQVTRAGEQDLLTMQSGDLLKRVDEEEGRRAERREELGYEHDL